MGLYIKKENYYSNWIIITLVYKEKYDLQIKRKSN